MSEKKIKAVDPGTYTVIWGAPPASEEAIEKAVAEFDSKFFIGGKNAYGEECALLFPAKVEVRDWLRTTLTHLLATQQRENVERMARVMIEASIVDEEEVTDEDFEGVSRVDAFMAGITHMHNAFRAALATLSNEGKGTKV